MEGGDDIYENGNVRVGSEFTVEGKNGGKLPDSFSCSIANEDGVLQTVTINTSGDEDLYLKNQFGSLQVESCDNQDCTVDVTYKYTVTNTGNTDLTITELDRERDGQKLDLIDELGKLNLRPGQSTSAPEKDTVDICVDGTYVTTAEVEGDSPAGATVSDTDDYEFEVTGVSPQPTPAPTPAPTPGDSSITVSEDGVPIDLNQFSCLTFVFVPSSLKSRAPMVMVQTVIKSLPQRPSVLVSMTLKLCSLSTVEAAVAEP